jgi:hypothetical protein
MYSVIFYTLLLSILRTTNSYGIPCIKVDGILPIIDLAAGFSPSMTLSAEDMKFLATNVSFAEEYLLRLYPNLVLSSRPKPTGGMQRRMHIGRHFRLVSNVSGGIQSSH